MTLYVGLHSQLAHRLRTYHGLGLAVDVVEEKSRNILHKMFLHHPLHLLLFRHGCEATQT